MAKKRLSIGILGGMGPEATLDVFRWILALTPAKKDQDHLRVFIDNNPQVPSRIKAILDKGKSPVPMLVEMAKGLTAQGADFLITPCNTTHYFLPEIRKQIKPPILDMIEETADHVIENHPRIKKLGLLATEATVRLGLYQTVLLEKKMELIYEDHHPELIEELVPKIRGRYYRLTGIQEVDGNVTVTSQHSSSKEDDYKFSVVVPKQSSQKKKVSKAIQGKHGIKAGYQYEPRQLLLSAVKELKGKGAQGIIMGCTEVPLVLRQKDSPLKLIDPTRVLAKLAVDIALGDREIGKDVLEG